MLGLRSTQDNLLLHMLNIEWIVEQSSSSKTKRAMQLRFECCNKLSRSKIGKLKSNSVLYTKMTKMVVYRIIRRMKRKVTVEKEIYPLPLAGSLHIWYGFHCIRGEPEKRGNILQYVQFPCLNELRYFINSHYEAVNSKLAIPSRVDYLVFGWMYRRNHVFRRMTEFLITTKYVRRKLSTNIVTNVILTHCRWLCRVTFELLYFPFAHSKILLF